MEVLLYVLTVLLVHGQQASGQGERCAVTALLPITPPPSTSNSILYELYNNGSITGMHFEHNGSPVVNFGLLGHSDVCICVCVFSLFTLDNDVSLSTMYIIYMYTLCVSYNFVCERLLHDVQALSQSLKMDVLYYLLLTFAIQQANGQGIVHVFTG